jgi:DNA-binding response OmpR family regulator
MSQEFTQRVMIVDDDEIVRLQLESVLQASFELLSLDSGDAALERVGQFRPDVVLLDIGMPGLDGFEACRRLRELEDFPSPEDQPAVVFVSARDSLEQRLQAYDSGGDDFIAKPPESGELLRKVQAMVRWVSERRRLRSEKDSVQRTAMDFLTTLGESGAALQFMRNSLSCTSLSELAELTMAAARDYGLSAHLQLRPPGQCLTFVDSGTASPLEESVFAQVRELDRIFQFRRQMIINFPHTSLLIRDMPIEDEERCGRLRDHLALVAEGCEAGTVAMIRSAEIETRTRQLRATAGAVEQAIALLRDQYRDQQGETALILHDMSEDLVQRMFLMGLSESQEEEMQAMLGAATEKALELFHRGPDFDAQLGRLMEILSHDLKPAPGPG